MSSFQACVLTYWFCRYFKYPEVVLKSSFLGPEAILAAVLFIRLRTSNFKILQITDTNLHANLLISGSAESTFGNIRSRLWGSLIKRVVLIQLS